MWAVQAAAAASPFSINNYCQFDAGAVTEFVVMKSDDTKTCSKTFMNSGSSYIF